MIPATPRTRRRRRTAWAIAAAALLPLAGCSSDGSDGRAATSTTEAPATTDGPGRSDETTTTTGANEPDPGPDGGGVAPTADEAPYVDALEAALVSEANTDLPLDAPTAACVAPRWVRTIGVDDLTAADLAPEDLNAATDGDRRSYFDVIADLGDPERAQELVGAFATCDVDLLDLILELLGGPGGLSHEQRACFADQLTTADVEAGLADALDGDDEQATTFEDDVQRAVSACLE